MCNNVGATICYHIWFKQLCSSSSSELLFGQISFFILIHKIKISQEERCDRFVELLGGTYLLYNFRCKVCYSKYKCMFGFKYIRYVCMSYIFCVWLGLACLLQLFQLFACMCVYRYNQVRSGARCQEDVSHIHNSIRLNRKEKRRFIQPKSASHFAFF